MIATLHKTETCPWCLGSAWRTPCSRCDGEGKVTPQQAVVHKVLRGLGWTWREDDRWMLSGSSVMALHGFPRLPQDVDIFTTTAHWFELSAQADREWGPHVEIVTMDPHDVYRCCDPPFLRWHADGIAVDIFYDWRERRVGNVRIADLLLHHREWVKGWPCLSLSFLFGWKLSVLRDKDADDIRMLREAGVRPHGFCERCLHRYGDGSHGPGMCIDTRKAA